MYQPKQVKTDKKFTAIPQPRFSKGYMSTLSNSRMPIDGLAKMVNMTLEQDAVPRPRPPFIPYGQPYLGICIGQGTFTKTVSGLPQYWEISMQVVSGVTGVYIRKDGATWTSVGGSYNTTAWATFTQGAAVNPSTSTEDNRIYISNGIDAMSYYDLPSASLITYVGLTTPSTPTLTPTGLTGTNFNQYYRISANNAGGESAASVSAHVAISTARDYWVSTSMNIAVSWSAVTGATSYNIYTADQSGQEAYLATVSGLTFTDDGTVSINIYKLAPSSDSSAGPKVSTMVNMDNQLFGCGDLTNPSYLWYSGQGQHFGDFSFNPQGGGYVGIDYGGDTTPTCPFPFHDGKGTPVLSILTYGASGYGKLFHMTLTTTTVGTTNVTYPSVYEGSSQDGTPAPLGVAQYNNSAYYCTGTAFKTTGLKPNVINILSTDTISDQLLPDLQTLNLAALPGAVAKQHLGKVYFALPTGASTVNNEIWILDLTRNGLWILRWPVSVQFIWTYQDNTGATHLLTLQNNTTLELDLDRVSTPTQDNGVAFSTELGGGAMVFDKGGVAMFSSYFTYFKFLFPSGDINVAVNGVTEDSTDEHLLASDQLNISADSSNTGWSQILYSNPDGSSVYDGNVGRVVYTSQSASVVDIEVDDIVNQQSWDITTNTVGCDYLLSSVTTTGYSIPMLYSGQ